MISQSSNNNDFVKISSDLAEIEAYLKQEEIPSIKEAKGGDETGSDLARNFPNENSIRK